MLEKLALSIKNLGFLQALGVLIYCGLVGLIFWKGGAIFGNNPSYVGPVAALLLLSVSVLICGTLVFYQPYKLFFAGKKKEAADLVVQTTFWLFIFFLLILIITILR